jgi:hypothetical protein
MLILLKRAIELAKLKVLKPSALAFSKNSDP